MSICAHTHTLSYWLLITLFAKKTPLNSLQFWLDIGAVRLSVGSAIKNICTSLAYQAYWFNCTGTKISRLQDIASHYRLELVPLHQGSWTQATLFYLRSAWMTQGWLESTAKNTRRLVSATRSNIPVKNKFKMCKYYCKTKVIGSISRSDTQGLMFSALLQAPSRSESEGFSHQEAERSTQSCPTSEHIIKQGC